ncbi:MAG: hypothetical protein GY725_04760, partial [bacterium]|nr:hypothetical protein [bacterium]
LVSEKLSLQRHLFWADIEETRQNTGGADNRPTNFWQARLRLETLWQLGSRDLVWLYEDLPKRSLLADQQVAFSAIIHVLRDIGNLEAEMPQLHALVSGSVELERMLDGVLTPFEESEVGCQIRRNQRHEEKIAKKKQEAKASWIRFREELEADPSMLADPALIANRNRGAVQRWELTRWLRRKTKKGYEEAALQWPLLEEGFSPTVAQAYRNGMKALWRLTSPERPKRKGNRVITKHVTLFAYAGLAIEAGEAPEWAHKLSPAEAERAAQHACLSEQGYPDWFEKLTDRHPATVLPILRQTLRDEWAGRYGGRSEFLSHYGFKAKQIHKAVHSILFEVITGKKPKALNVLDCGREVLVRLKLTDPERRRATALALRRLRAARAAADDEPLWRYFGWLFFLDADRAVHELIEWLDAAPRASRDARTESTVAALFGLSGFATGALATVSVESLEALLRLTDRYVRPEDDSSPDGRDTPDTRDQAERAREVLLKALIDRPGAAAYHAMRAISAAEISKARSVHLGQLTHGKAEHDAELPAWSPTEVLHFERHLIAPAKTGEALLRVVLGVLSDIQNSFRRAD